MMVEEGFMESKEYEKRTNTQQHLSSSRQNRLSRLQELKLRWHQWPLEGVVNAIQSY